MAYANQRFKHSMVGCISTGYSNFNQLPFSNQFVFQISAYTAGAGMHAGTLSLLETVNQEAGDGERPFRNDPRL